MAKKRLDSMQIAKAVFEISVSENPAEKQRLKQQHIANVTPKKKASKKKPNPKK